MRTGVPFRTDPSPARIAADYYVPAGTSSVSTAGTGIAPSMITDAVFAASCNDFDDR